MARAKGAESVAKRLARRADAFVNEELERAILALCLASRPALDAAVAILTPSDFSVEAHKAIWIALASLQKQDANPNLVSLWAEMERGGLGHHIGTPSDLSAYLEQDDRYRPEEIAAYCKSLRSYTIARRQRDLGSALQQSAATPMTDEERVEMMRRAAEEISSLCVAGERLEGMDDLLKRVDINDFSNPSRREVYIETPWQRLNDMLIGFRVGRFYVIGAYTSHGKSSFALNIALHAAIRLRMPVAYYPLEMEGEEMFRLAACNLAGVNNLKVARGLLDREENVRFMEAVERLRNAPLKISNLFGRSVSDIRASILYERSRGFDVKLAIVDHMQLMHAATNAKDLREAFTAIGNDLLRLAMEMDVCVIALSQLRRPDRRSDKRPTIEDFRETSAFAEAATAAAVLYRPEFFKVNGDRSRVVLFLDKNRGGKTGRVELRAIDKYCRYEEEEIESPED